jgi:hypothetical protein
VRALAVAASAVAAAAVGVILSPYGERPPPPPAQPIPFNHRIHAGEAGIGCTACHSYAEQSTIAGIPSMARCQGCHKFVKQDPERPEVTKEIKVLLDRLKDGKPIEWVRVYRVPDHVFFTHQRHVAAGLRCQECHGEVEKMDVMRRVSSLTMGWCLECHRRKQAEKPVERARLTDCVTCHK